MIRRILLFAALLALLVSACKEERLRPELTAFLDRFALLRGIVANLDRDIEGVHVDVRDAAGRHDGATLQVGDGSMLNPGPG